MVYERITESLLESLAVLRSWCGFSAFLALCLSFVARELTSTSVPGALVNSGSSELQVSGS